MAQKIPDPADSAVLAANQRYLAGRIEAVLHLTSLLVAKLSPELAAPLLGQIAELKTKAKYEPLSAYEKGFASAEDELLQALKTVDEVQKIL